MSPWRNGTVKVEMSVTGAAALEPDIQHALIQKLLAMGDDELILAHRNSEWCGHAPILEEDIAFANIAQDELGHAGLWYGLLQALDGSDPDHLVFFRYAHAFRNVRMVELPKGDWAFSILRQYLFDSYEVLTLGALADSAFRDLAEAAEKARSEEIYHLRHTQAWVRRLGLGTPESKRRMQAALDQLWLYAGQLFAPLTEEEHLVQAAVVPAPGEQARRWREMVVPFLQTSDLQVDELISGQTAGREVHTEYLLDLVGELQQVARAEPEASW